MQRGHEPRKVREGEQVRATDYWAVPLHYKPSEGLCIKELGGGGMSKQSHGVGVGS